MFLFVGHLGLNLVALYKNLYDSEIKLVKNGRDYGPLDFPFIVHKNLFCKDDIVMSPAVLVHRKSI